MTAWSKLIIAMAVLLACCVLSLSTGPSWIAPHSVFNALLQADPSNVDHLLVNTTRLSRTLIAVVVGASLAVAGALMQAMTCLLYTSPSPRDLSTSRMPSSA